MSKVLIIETPCAKSLERERNGVYFRPADRWRLVMGSFLASNGHEVRIVPALNSVRETTGIIRRQGADADLISVSCSIENFRNALTIARRAKDIAADLPVALSGPHFTWLDSEVLESNPFIDFVIRGPGQDAMLGLAEMKPLQAIKGLTYRDGSGIRRNPEPGNEHVPVVSADLLEAYLMEVDALCREKGLKGIRYNTQVTTGCDYGCIFCIERLYFKRTVTRDADDVIRELKVLAGFGKTVHGVVDFYDSSFTRNLEFKGRLLGRLAEGELPFSYTLNSRVNEFDQRVASMLKDAGFAMVKFGIESAHPSVLKAMRKGISREAVLSALSAAKKAGLQIRTNWIIGHPGDTLERSMYSLRFAEMLKKRGLSDSFGVSAYIPFPGTEPFRHPERFGMRFVREGWMESVGEGVIVEYDYFPANEISYMLKMFETL